MPAESAFRDGPRASYELIETMRFEDGVFVRLDRHMERMCKSAETLGFRFESEAIHSALDGVREGAAIQRVRLTLTRDGAVYVTTAPFIPLPPDAVWRLAIAQTRLDSGNPLLRHKTTLRAAYDAARGEFLPDAVDEVLLLNERDEICEGTITSIFVNFDDEFLATPPLSCGLLGGVMRAELLEAGQAHVSVLTASMIARARAIFVGNSLRGLIPAMMVGFNNQAAP